MRLVLQRVNLDIKCKLAIVDDDLPLDADLLVLLLVLLQDGQDLRLRDRIGSGHSMTPSESRFGHPSPNLAQDPGFSGRRTLNLERG